MALTRSAAQALASTSNAAGATTNSSAFAVGYGVSGVATITNGGTGPTVPCDFVLQVSNDAGTTWFEWSRQTAATTASATYRFPFALAPGGLGGDFGHWRGQFASNTAQGVTVAIDAQSTTAY